MANIQIYLVDSDQATIGELNKALEKDYILTHFNSAEEALPLVIEKSPEVVIFEYQLPGMTGIEFFEKVQASNQTKSLLIMISSLDDGNMVLKFIQKGVRNYIMKDEMLVDSVKEVLSDEL